MKRNARIVSAIAALLLLISSFSIALSEDYTLHYRLLSGFDNPVEYKLVLSVPEPLYSYYKSKTHELVSMEDFAKFVTPNAFTPVAEKLREIYRDDEDFVNGVLMLVHQIPYAAAKSPKYPVETLVDNSGDCGLLSYLAASIMKAGDVDVVLFYYEDINHMNVGVSLSHTPVHARQSPSYIMFNGTRYYIAECTGGDLVEGWRVGECPENLKYEKVKVVSLKNCEHFSPGWVSASYFLLKETSISLKFSSPFVFQGDVVFLSGRLTPKLSDKRILLYVKVDSDPWKFLSEVETDSMGNFSYALRVNGSSVCYVQAKWLGDESYAGAQSPIVSVFILSPFFILLSMSAILITCTCMVFLSLRRQMASEERSTRAPDVPSLGFSEKFKA